MVELEPPPLSAPLPSLRVDVGAGPSVALVHLSPDRDRHVPEQLLDGSGIRRQRVKRACQQRLQRDASGARRGRANLVGQLRTLDEPLVAGRAATKWQETREQEDQRSDRGVHVRRLTPAALFLNYAVDLVGRGSRCTARQAIVDDAIDRVYLDDQQHQHVVDIARCEAA